MERQNLDTSWYPFYLVSQVIVGRNFSCLFFLLELQKKHRNDSDFKTAAFKWSNPMIEKENGGWVKYFVPLTVSRSHERRKLFRFPVLVTHDEYFNHKKWNQYLNDEIWEGNKSSKTLVLSHIHISSSLLIEWLYTTESVISSY